MGKVNLPIPPPPKDKVSPSTIHATFQYESRLEMHSPEFCMAIFLMKDFEDQDGISNNVINYSLKAIKNVTKHKIVQGPNQA